MPKSITLTSLDIGTGSVIGLTARKDLRTGEIEILAKAQCPCFGVRNSEVVKPLQVADVIRTVAEKLSRKSGLKIKDVLVNIGGTHLFSVPSQGLVSVSRADQKISREDIERVIMAARAVILPSNKAIINVFAKEFIVDGEGGIKEPLGLQGIRLEAKVLLICLFSPILENLERAVAEAGLQILDATPSLLGASRAVLNQEQKELGVLLVDIGAGSTSVAVFEKGDLIDFAIFPVGSSNITNDLAIGLRTEIHTAEKIKREFGRLGPIIRKGKDKIELPERGLVFPKKFLKNVIEARVSQIFAEIQKVLKKISSGEQLPAGVVLTGGGSKLPGIVEFAKQKFKLPCRLGSFYGIPELDDPEFSSCAGLLLLAFDGEASGKEKIINDGLREKIKSIFRTFLP